jgi:hypothetical protein
MYIVFPRLCRINDEQLVSFVVVYRDQFDMGFELNRYYVFLPGSRPTRLSIKQEEDIRLMLLQQWIRFTTLT